MYRLEIIGNIGQDAETKPINGKDYYSFSIAYTEKRNGQNKTYWVRCLRLVGESNKLGNYLKKGQQVYISGMPYTSAYINKDNKAIADQCVFVNNLQLLGGRPQSVQNTSQGNSAPADDDLPF
ncbi:single-stranded DNA-binding protein [Dysgonomonas sp. 521]|uniref:single-stranded DNA-binding protein n=1 Tax=Dysgonomonas sp. 521 TaxID=2302932 RepID=UPI0013CFD513|nr:single-stranded DNA-binding protein [Dysgonomonas sp. 521]